jgi:hypothetical protein
MPRRKNPKDTRKISLSDFYCTLCGNKGIPIFRSAGKEREAGHLKKIFCLYCQKETNMVEVRTSQKYPLEYFWIEYNYGNFDKEGNRKEEWKKFISRIKREKEENEK